MTRYLALLRGINVGGKSLIKMPALRAALEEDGFADVITYIQSGNVFVTSTERSGAKVSAAISATIAKHFALDVSVVSFTKPQWESVINSAPDWWGTDAEWRHNLIVLIPPGKPADVVKALGDIKPEVDQVEAGKAVVYASLRIAVASRSRISRIVGTPVYKQLTVRNHNTSTKLLNLFD